MPDVNWATGDITFDNFDPNKGFAKQPVWGIFDGARFKTYAKRGYAMNGFRHLCQAKLFELTPEGWVLRATKVYTGNAAGPDVCGNCGGTTIEIQRSYRRNAGRYRFRRKHGKYVEPLDLVFCCPGCVTVVNCS